MSGSQRVQFAQPGPAVRVPSIGQPLPPVERLLRRVERELRAGTPRHLIHRDLESARWRRQYGAPACQKIQALMRRGAI